MSPLESILFWITLTIYALVSGAYVYSLVFKNDRVLPWITWALSAGFVLHTATIGARYAATGHLPWSGDYEVALMFGWFMVVCVVWVAWKKPALSILGVGGVPLSLLLMGYGAMRNPTLTPMDASLKTWWLYIHVFFAQIAFGAWGLAMGAGILYLIKQKKEKLGELAEFWKKVPNLERLDELMFRYIIFGFITDTVMIAAGSIWARDLWGSYWSWDPVETWSLITWVIYGLAIHLRVTRKWRGTKLAWLAIFAILGMVITFFGVHLVVDTSNHFFNVEV